MSQVSPLGRRLRRLRGARGLSQTGLAARAGVARSLVANLENGARDNITLANATKLADALGISLDLLARGSLLDAEEEESLAIARA
jgi:transcriptional regulator with XRE-family HTH domain